MLRIILSTLTALCSVTLGYAAQSVSDDSITNKTHRLEGITVSSRQSRSAVTSGTMVQTMNNVELEALGLGSLADAIKHFTGANVKDYGGIGGLKTVSVRNLGAEHTAVSYDGVVVSNTQAGQIDVGRFALDNVQSLSLAIGDNGDLMQTARHYASAGILSITTEKPHFEQGRDHSLRFRINGGSFGYVTPSLRYWQRLGGTTVMSLQGYFSRADGAYPYTLSYGRYVTKERRINSDINAWMGEADVFHDFNDKESLNLKAYFYHSNRGLPGAVILYNPTSNERLWDEDFFVQSVYKNDISRKWSLQAIGKYTHSWNRYEDKNVKYTDGMMKDINRQDEYYASATACWHPTECFSMALAQDIAVNTLRTNINGSPNPLRFTSLTSLSAVLKTERLSVKGNVVNTFATEHIKINEGFIGEEPKDKKRLSPSLSVSVRLLNDAELYLRAFTKGTFRMPTFNDLYYLRIGNTSLRPEIASEYGIGAAWSIQSEGCLRYLSVTVDGYYNNVKDKIVAFPSTYIWKMTNYGKVKACGIDANVTSDMQLAKGWNLSVVGSVSVQNAKDMTDPNTASYKSQLPYTPKVNGSASAILRTPLMTVGYSIVGQGKRYSMAQNTPEYEIDPYVDQTLTLSKSFRLGRSVCDVNVSVHNLADKQYEVIKYYPMPGRSWSAGMSIRL